MMLCVVCVLLCVCMLMCGVLLCCVCSCYGILWWMLIYADVYCCNVLCCCVLLCVVVLAYVASRICVFPAWPGGVVYLYTVRYVDV